MTPPVNDIGITRAEFTVVQFGAILGTTERVYLTNAVLPGWVVSYVVALEQQPPLRIFAMRPETWYEATGRAIVRYGSRVKDAWNRWPIYQLPDGLSGVHVPFARTISFTEEKDLSLAFRGIELDLRARGGP